MGRSGKDRGWDGDSDVRSGAASVLGELKDPRAVEPLIQALKDIYSYVREDAAESLGLLKDSRAVDPMIQALNDSDDSVRKSAAEALGKLNDRRAVDPLIQVRDDKNEYKSVQDAAAQALEKLRWARIASASPSQEAPTFPIMTTGPVLEIIVYWKNTTSR